MMCQDDYIDASTNSPLYLMNQGGCPGYKSGSATPSPSQGGGDPFVSCFYSKLKHCKSYFGVSTQTTGITMLIETTDFETHSPRLGYPGTNPLLQG